MKLPTSSVVAVCSIMVSAVAAPGQSGGGPEGRTVFATEAAEALEWDARIQIMEGGHELRRVAVRADTVAPGWRHERFQQQHRGVPVFGAQLVRHLRDGQVMAVNGRLYEGIASDTLPAIAPGQAQVAAEDALGLGAQALGSPELLLYPDRTGLRLAYRLHVRTRGDLFLVVVDANTGAVVDRWSDLRRQAVVGRGTGTWGDVKKISTTRRSGTFVARDGLRPAVQLTVDVKGDLDSWNRYAIDPESSAAEDPDNDWRDAAVVDAHVYAGWTYDYLYRELGREGIDGNNSRLVSYVHFLTRDQPVIPELSFNAFWDPRDLSLNYGDGDGTLISYMSGAIDVVAHEHTHGVTQFTSGLVYRDESGALDESICDIIAISTEFFFEERGRGRQRSDWLLGEDVVVDNFGARLSAFRYPPDPAALGDPDHYSVRYRGQQDNGGVHWNSLISTHAYYLFVEGGVNRTSGVAVQGIGFANLDRATKIFYRAFTEYLVPVSVFSDARSATLQSARDLYGPGSQEEQQLAQAWAAVGVE